MLKYLDPTRRLRGLYPYPDPHDHMLPQIITAYSQEVSEVLNELKGWWAWWSTKPVDRDKLIEELADVMFFYLIYVMHAQDHQHGFRMDRFQVLLNQEGASVRWFRQGNQTDIRQTRNNVMDALHRLQLDVMGAISRPYETLLRLHGTYSELLDLLGVTPHELERAYVKKFLVNLERTGQAHTPEGLALHEEMVRQLAELELSAASETARRINEGMVA